MLLRTNRRRIARAAAIALVSALCALRLEAQSTTVPLAEGSGVQPLFVLDSGAAWSANWIRATSCAKSIPGYLGEYYNAFVTSVTDWSRHLQFEPRRLGGCPVKEVVQLPLAFVQAGSPRGEAARKRPH